MRFLPLVVFALAAGTLPAQVEIATDHSDALYRCGEKAAFTIRVTDGKSLMTTGTVSVVLDNFGPKELSRRTHALAEGNPFVVEGTRSDPGFLRLTVNGAGGKTVWGVGFEPERIRPVTPVPDDFDAFWAAARKRLAETVPLDPQMVKVPERCTAAFDYYRLSFATFGRRVYGYMSIPTAAARAPFPVQFRVAAAGFGDWTNDMAGSPHSIQVLFSVYTFEPHWKWKEIGLQKTYEKMVAACVKKYGCGYPTSGAGVSREDYFYYPVILGIDRAIDWLAARADVDASRIVYAGTSQGGGMGLALTALNKHISRAAFYVPALTDTLAGDAGRQSGWPRPVEGQHTPEARAMARRVMPYFDGASFATRITCPVRFAVGFADTTCAPHCTRAAFNALASQDKRLCYGIGMGHGVRGEFCGGYQTWLDRAGTKKPPLIVTLTFDDNTRDFATLVSPMLGRYGWKGIFNVIVGRVGKGGLTWDDLRSLRDAGHEIANHSLTHPDLVRLLEAGKTDDVRREIVESRNVFERELGRKPDWFCYPGNHADNAVRQMVSEAGMRSMSCGRPNYGYQCPPWTEKGAYISLLREIGRGARHIDLMIHGVRRGGGWLPFETTEQFGAFLDELKALETEGLIRVLPYSEAHKTDR